jgi:hypothetical protein
LAPRSEIIGPDGERDGIGDISHVHQANESCSRARWRLDLVLQ